MNKTKSYERVAALRDFLKTDAYAAIVVPRADSHANGYIAPSEERVAFLSDFTGSAGIAVITMERAILLTDGRYTAQAADQLASDLWEVVNIKDSTISELLRDLTPGSAICIDPKRYLYRTAVELREKLIEQNLKLEMLSSNPIDAMWEDQPEEPNNPFDIYPDTLAGASARDKITKVAATLSNDNVDGLVVSALDNLAWLLNIRGTDLAMSPVTFGHAIVSSDGNVVVYLTDEKLQSNAATQLNAVDGISCVLDSNMTFEAWHTKTLRFDKRTASAHLVASAESQGVVAEVGDDPITSMKACKNEIELGGMRAAHVRDGVAMVKFLRWFAEVRKPGCTEWDAAEQLAAFRQEAPEFRTQSFPTISAVSDSSALPHYRPSKERPKAIDTNALYLKDSGAQYIDGTTDITRVTVAGDPTPEMVRRYTLVLKGHIALSRQRFPKGTNGAQLDAIARQPLWQAGVDFDHGTGHGVGHYLNVHEGPQSISPRGNGVALEVGMIVSNEPGYYEPGLFGIRIENLIVVRRCEQIESDRDILEFETLTLAPYERALIEPSALTHEEVAWIDTYHAQVRETLSPLVEGAVHAYLVRMTEPLRDS